MDDKRKLRYQDGELERLRQEAAGLRAELRAVEHTLGAKEAELRDAREELDALKRAYDGYLYRYSEQMEALAEAQRAYELAAKKMDQSLRRYGKEAAKWIREMRSV